MQTLNQTQEHFVVVVEWWGCVCVNKITRNPSIHKQ